MTPIPNAAFNNTIDGSLSLDASVDMTGSLMLSEYQKEIGRLRFQNNQLLMIKETKEREFENMMFENQTLYSKLENLENVFIG